MPASLSLVLLLFLLWLLFFLLEPRMAALGAGLVVAARVAVVLVGPAVVLVVASDSLSTIRELWGVPVMAIPNTGPEGPCKNTRVDVPLVEEALRILLKRPASDCTIH